jgi:hypothetical protein
MEENIKEYDLKLPSDPNVVTPNNIWKTAIVIANFGKIFTDEELTKNGSPVNEKNLFRILSYMRYLGLLVEKREKTAAGGKSKTIQRWLQADDKEVQDYFHYLSGNRLDEAKRIFIDLIKKHDLYKAIKTDLLHEQRIITEADLRDYFRRKIPGKSAKYYQKGSHFVIRFLSDFCNLIMKEGNKIKLREIPYKSAILSDDINNIGEKPAETGNSKFIIRIEGSDGTSFKYLINRKSDLDDVGSLINIIRKKLQKDGL